MYCQTHASGDRALDRVRVEQLLGFLHSGSSGQQCNMHAHEKEPGGPVIINKKFSMYIVPDGA